MDKYIYDENNRLWYELQGKCYLPCFTLPPEEEKHIGIWGRWHLRYIKEHKRLFYVNLLTSGKLNSYLADIDGQAEEMFSWLVKQIADSEGVTEWLKADNQLKWVRRMNNIFNQVTEIVNNDIIYR